MAYSASMEARQENGEKKYETEKKGQSVLTDHQSALAPSKTHQGGGAGARLWGNFQLNSQ